MGQRDLVKNCIRCPWHNLNTPYEALKRRSLPSVRIGSKMDSPSSDRRAAATSNREADTCNNWESSFEGPVVKAVQDQK